MKNEKEKQPDRFGVGRGKFYISDASENKCLVALKNHIDGPTIWEDYLPLQFKTELERVERLEKDKDAKRKKIARLTKKLAEEQHQTLVLRGTVIKAEEQIESLQILLNASKEAQEYLKEEYNSLSDGSKYLKERNEELTRQLQTSERNRKNTEEEKNDLEVKYESLLETVKSERNNSKIYFWGSIAIILLMLAKILWV